MTSLRQRMLEDMQIRNLAVNTQESYVQQVSLFARYFNQSPERLGPEQIRAYQVYLTNERKLATGSILIAISAFRQNFADAHLSHPFSEVIAKDSIAVPQQVARELFEGKCLGGATWGGA